MKLDRTDGGKVHYIPIDGTALNNPYFCMALLCVLAGKTESKVLEFSQADISSVAGMFLAEGQDEETGNFLVKLMTRKEIGVQDN